MSNKKNKEVYKKRNISRDDAITFIKLSSLNKEIFFMEEKIEAKIISRGSSLKLISSQILNKNDIITFKFGNEFLDMNIEENNEFSLINSSYNVEEKEENYFEYNGLLTINNEIFEIIGLSSNYICFNVLKDNFDFILSSVGNNLLCDFSSVDSSLNFNIEGKIFIQGINEEKITVRCININSDKRYLNLLETLNEENKKILKEKTFKRI